MDEKLNTALAMQSGNIRAKVLQGINRIIIGASVRLWSIEGVAEDLGVSADAALSLLDALGLPRLALPGSPKRYVNLYALESCIFAMSLPTKMSHTIDGSQDPELIRLHQELAGTIYLAGTKEMVRERVKKLAKELGRSINGVKLGRKPGGKNRPKT